MQTNLKQLRRGPQAEAYAPGFQCDRCHAVFKGDTESVAHCSQCEYDVCAGCTAAMAALLQCRAHHRLRAMQTAELCQESAGYRTGFRCDECNVSWPAGTCSMHCSLCLTYDLCPACVQRTLGLPVVAVSPITNTNNSTNTGRVAPMRAMLGAIAPPPMRSPPHHPAVHHPRVPMMAGKIAPPWVEQVQQEQEVPGMPGLSAEWRSVIHNAHICEESLREERWRRMVLDVVGGCMVPPRLNLTALPPISATGRSPGQLSTLIRGVWIGWGGIDRLEGPDDSAPR